MKIDDTGLFTDSTNQTRCWWCQGDAEYERYHDEEWGHPVTDDQRLFEKICLEGFQSGLSWLTILRKRENFRQAFHDFDFSRIAGFTSRQVGSLLKNKGIIRHKGKIEATINNAARAIEMKNEFGSLAAWFWQFEPNLQGRAPLHSKLEACMRTTCESAMAMSKELRKRGWKFTGPTTSYAFMQAMGMVNDHIVGCSKFESSEQLRKSLIRPRL